MWINLKMLHMWRNFRFLHMTDFFFTYILVILVTNMRYAINKWR